MRNESVTHEGVADSLCISVLRSACCEARDADRNRATCQAQDRMVPSPAPDHQRIAYLWK